MSSTETPWRSLSRSSRPAGQCELENRKSLSRGSGNNTSDAESKDIPPRAQSPKRERASSLTDLPPDPDASLTEEQRKQVDRDLVTRLDWRLMPWLCLLYLLAFLDRTNIGNAKIAGLGPDLGLDTTHYNMTLSIFFVSYALAEPVTNVLLKRFRPSLFIPIIMILWGICMLCMGFVHNWSGLMASRWFLGLTEAGLFPGVNYYLSCWYKRSEFGIRAAIFFSAAAIAGSFGGLLAALIEKMAGMGGRPGWAWIFILEGLLTVLVGFASFRMVHDFPDEARFLSAADRARVTRRLKLDQQSSASREDFSWAPVMAALSDWKTWLAMCVYAGCDMPLYAFSLFLPSIVAGLGWGEEDQGGGAVRAQLMTVPPYVAAALLTVLAGRVADRTGQRGLVNVAAAAVGIAGFAVLLAAESPAWRYAGTFLGAAGIYPCVANTISWTANNVEGVYKRGVVLGMVIGWGNLNGVTSSHVYFSPPRFVEGHAVVLGFMAVFLLGGSVLMTLLLRAENARRLRGGRDSWTEGKTRREVEALGDMRPDFLYIV
ncbi:hypothetical protein GGTG_09113 [Gaeumannomyces tritici R3-111a-1]|uniref:Major facilitator superfamily (MFS) profile domain-containing protein n=1 Tax=Gaeumannomyces tritici (strain R3-111a-1) TaxID=644352 RepID=J3P6H3_GAET3|nr:hypothetical protein GGTG_09113 [Gaeumannomyces tritici R3-111a-1]EJT72247.1 hypothetical protein GGTG_09113 [Gaeumannomyces tritici R3-111a-1]